MPAIAAFVKYIVPFILEREMSSELDRLMEHLFERPRARIHWLTQEEFDYLLTAARKLSALEEAMQFASMRHDLRAEACAWLQQRAAAILAERKEGKDHG